MIEHVHGATVRIVEGATGNPLLRVHAPGGRLLGWMLAPRCTADITRDGWSLRVVVTGDINGMPYELIDPLTADEAGRPCPRMGS